MKSVLEQEIEEKYGMIEPCVRKDDVLEAVDKYAATDYHTDAYDLLQIAAIALFGITAIVSAVVAINVIPQIVRFSVAPYPAFLQDVLRLLGRS